MGPLGSLRSQKASRHLHVYVAEVARCIGNRYVVARAPVNALSCKIGWCVRQAFETFVDHSDYLRSFTRISWACHDVFNTHSRAPCPKATKPGAGVRRGVRWNNAMHVQTAILLHPPSGTAHFSCAPCLQVYMLLCEQLSEAIPDVPPTSIARVWQQKHNRNVGSNIAPSELEVADQSPVRSSRAPG